MKIPDSQAILMVAIMSIITFIIRGLPFVLFPGDKKTPPFISYLGKVLPYSIIAMLVIYCLKDVKFLDGLHGLPELISILCVVILHVWKRNNLLSIGGGTLLYMFLVQVIFQPH